MIEGCCRIRIVKRVQSGVCQVETNREVVAITDAYCPYRRVRRQGVLECPDIRNGAARLQYRGGCEKVETFISNNSSYIVRRETNFRSSNGSGSLSLTGIGAVCLPAFDNPIRDAERAVRR